MIIPGIVKEKLPNNELKIELQVDQSCATCRSSCSGKPCAQEIIIKDQRGYALGDKVQIEMNSYYFLLALSLVFIVPLVFLIAVIMICRQLGLNDGFSLGIGLLGFFGGLILANRYDQYLRTKNLYKLL